MSNFRFDSRSGNSRDNRDGGRPPLHDAICNECGKDCRVPFRPSGSKPVYCSECFEGKGGGRDDGRSNQRGSYNNGNRSRSGGDSNGNRSRFSGGDSRGPDFSQLTKSIEILNNKLDKIIFLLGSELKMEVKTKTKGKVKTETKRKVKAKKAGKSSVKKSK
jgi:CxxC-x17-CxxC domain-containing protein